MVHGLREVTAPWCFLVTTKRKEEKQKGNGGATSDENGGSVVGAGGEKFSICIRSAMLIAKGRVSNGSASSKLGQGIT
jgi:hypothetical protein